MTRSKPGSRSRAYLGAASTPAIIAAASSPDWPPLRSTTATRNSANKVSRSKSVDIAAISGRMTARIELSTYTGHGDASPSRRTTR